MEHFRKGLSDIKILIPAPLLLCPHKSAPLLAGLLSCWRHHHLSCYLSPTLRSSHWCLFWSCLNHQWLLIPCRINFRPQTMIHNMVLTTSWSGLIHPIFTYPWDSCDMKLVFYPRTFVVTIPSWMVFLMSSLVHTSHHSTCSLRKSSPHLKISHSPCTHTPWSQTAFYSYHFSGSEMIYFFSCLLSVSPSGSVKFPVRNFTCLSNHLTPTPGS